MKNDRIDYWLSGVVCLVLMMLFGVVGDAGGQEKYPVHPDSKVQEGVPKGKLVGPLKWESKIFPGTVREYGIYVPAQYDGKKPACVLVVQDGIGKARGWKLPTVMDNLIHKEQMPVTIGIFVSPGVVPAPNKDAQARYNRSFEYDGMGDRYARFLLEEILPAVGEKYNLSNDPNDRMIAGSSSGGICAFTVAWERPNEFRRVFSSVGTFVGLRGGDAYPVLVRKTETKPIRVFLQDGKNDLNIYPGGWWEANLDMLASLKFAGYDVKHVWGEGGHNGKHATAIMPDALKWLWRDYPKPIEAGKPAKRRMDILLDGEGWELVCEGHKFTEGPAVVPGGMMVFTDIPNGHMFRVNFDGNVKRVLEDTKRLNGLMFSKDGYLYGCEMETESIVRFDKDGKREVVVENAPCNDLVVLPNGDIYFTDPGNKKVWLIRDGEKRVVDTGIERPNGIMTSPDNTLLNVADSRGRFVYSFQIQPDGSLKHKQRFGHLHLADDPVVSGADGMTMDKEGRLYVATRVGIQVLDQPGRVHWILPLPGGAKPSNVAFGGPRMDVLYVTARDKVYRRKLKTKGARVWRESVKPPKPNL